MERETMGQRLQRLRELAGMTQADLAKAAKVPMGTIRNWEQDRRTPRLDSAYKVAQALGVSLDVLAAARPVRQKQTPKPKGKGGAA